MLRKCFPWIIALQLILAPNIEAATRQGKYKLFPDREQRILVESGEDQMLFLRGSRYALVNGSFVELESPVAENEDNWRPPAYHEPRLTPLPVVAATATRAAQTCKIQRIFLDPGHGGSDFGTTLGGVFEKNVALSFAQKAEKELQLLGFKTILSRSRDVFLPLDIRPVLAKEWQADLFISIHMNSSPSKTAHGTETYILSADATDAEARKLALAENSKQAAQKGGATPLSDILWDMEQTIYLQESAYLASSLQQSITKAAHSMAAKKQLKLAWKNRGVRQAPFFVLSRAAMPAILLELGYLSHPGDRSFLLSREFQEKLAKALAAGVRSYAETCKTRSKG